MYDFLMWIGGIIATGLFGLIGWVLKMIFDAIGKIKHNHDVHVQVSNDDRRKIERQIAEHKLHAAETFATKVDVQSGFDKIMLKLENISTKFDRFDEKLDKKADKADVR